MQIFRRIVFAFVFFTMAAAPIFAQDKRPEQLRMMTQPELDILKVLLQQERDWNRGDLDSFATGYKKAPDTLFLGGNFTRGYEALVANYHKTYPTRETMGQLTFSDLDPRILDGSFALITGAYHLERSKKFGGSADGAFSLVLEKTDAGWKIILDHTT
jgi:ketosteroid isomerase-like protein